MIDNNSEMEQFYTIDFGGFALIESCFNLKMKLA